MSKLFRVVRRAFRSSPVIGFLLLVAPASSEAAQCGDLWLNTYPGPPTVFTYATTTGDVVDLDFSGVLDAVLDRSQPELNCGTRKFTVTSVAGVATFIIYGGSIGVADPSLLSTIANVKLIVNGTATCEVSFHTWDLDSVNGVGAADLSVWLNDWASLLAPTRSNFDGDAAGVVNGADLSNWLAKFGSGQATISPSVLCGP